MSTTAAQNPEYSVPLFMAQELSNSKWKLAFSPSYGQKPRERTIVAGDLTALRREIGKARERFDLPGSVPVVSCYEAGRDGFWLHRHLKSQGVDNSVVDPASIEVNRRARRRKTDRLDVRKLLRQLIRSQDDPKVWSVVRVPTAEQEDDRQLHRELGTLTKEKTAHSNRIKGLLVTQGIRLPVNRTFLARLSEVRTTADGSALGAGLRSRLEREYQRLELIWQQMRELKAKRRQALRDPQKPSDATARHLYRLRAIGETGAWVVSKELLAWRRFNNRREVGSAAGLTPAPFASGANSKDQGIDKAGNRRIRPLMIELSWSWLRLQPDSELSHWFQERFGHGTRRQRRVGIVALARKLLVALWRYSDQGIVPGGAVLKA